LTHSASDERVTLVIKESLVRRSDRERIEYVRTATYKIVDGVIRECWIVDAPPVELAEFLRETAGSTPSSPTSH
jgi:hypothetical protein